MPGGGALCRESTDHDLTARVQCCRTPLVDPVCRRGRRGSRRRARMKFEGVVRFRDPPAEPFNATVRVRLLDTTRAGASSETTAEQTIEDVSLAGAGAPAYVRFALEASDLSPGRRYSLMAHIDASGNGEIEAGDYITMESVPLEARAAGTELEIPVSRVRS